MKCNPFHLFERHHSGGCIKPFPEVPPDRDIEEKMWKSVELFTYFADWKVERIDEAVFEDNSGGAHHYHCMDTIICRKVI